jgi:molybdopterin-guanine dinucleotide biosynthesis protein A
MQSITGVILAGGMGRRMDNRDKGLVVYKNKPLIEHAIGILQPQVDDCLIIANRSHDTYKAYGHRVIPDVVSGYQGPLVGMASGLQAALTDWVVFIPCDEPYLPTDLVKRLSLSIANSGANLAVAHDGHRLHPVVSLVHVSLLPALLSSIQNNHLKLQRWFDEQGAAVVDFSDCPECFVNINTQADLEKLST